MLESRLRASNPINDSTVPTADSCDVAMVLFSTGHDDTDTGDLADIPPAQARRLHRIQPGGACRQFIAARRLARSVLAQRLQVDAKAVELRQRCATCRSEEHGAPQPVAGVHVSWAHCADGVVAAVDDAAIGVDIEPIRPFRDATDGLIGMMCTPMEARSLPGARAHALARVWTTKEALIKIGQASLGTLRDCDLGPVHPARDRWRYGYRGWNVSAFEWRGVAVAVASRSAARHVTLGWTRGDSADDD